MSVSQVESAAASTVVNVDGVSYAFDKVSKDQALDWLLAGKIDREQFAAIDAANAPKPTIVITENMTGEQFAILAKCDDEESPLIREVTMSGCNGKIRLKAMRFSSGSVGFNMSGKIDVNVGGKTGRMQVTGNLILIGSKPQ